MAIFRYAACLAATCLWAAVLPTAVASDAENVPSVDPYAARQAYYDQYWQQKLENALAYIPGVIVQVTIDLNPEVRQEIRRTLPAGTPVTVEQRESESTKRSGPGSASKKGKKGKKGNEPKTEETKREAYSRTVPYETTTNSVIAGLTPRSANAVVVLPSGYVDAHHEQARKRIVADVQRMAETLLPYYSRAPRVTVVVTADHATRDHHGRVARIDGPPPLDASRAPLRRGDVITVRLNDEEHVAARVATVLDDGTLVLESRRELRVDGATVVTEFSGRVRPEDVGPDRSVAADAISELRKHTTRARVRRPR
ncbi:flagellar basal body L-ring protein [Posidoniimonas polymericola]|uniref:Flagellar basal body L-ring protein n=1 Tax=Posidoniimonas polymericola TaxID=2528002 RepID=A0A5C5XZG0_9BACT|nr:flagellar basal body L-ring protein FlgH [Posidoniimonas polymericola]TWT67673.1 flagellar basal body L-ring protein [Posidoniimonas polymericola]